MWTKKEMSGGIDSIHTKNGQDFFALLTKAWATPLSFLLTWEKEQDCSKPIIDLQSLIIWPKLDRLDPSLDKALNTISKSHSTTHC